MGCLLSRNQKKNRCRNEETRVGEVEDLTRLRLVYLDAGLTRFGSSAKQSKHASE